MTQKENDLRALERKNQETIQEIERRENEQVATLAHKENDLLALENRNLETLQKIEQQKAEIQRLLQAGNHPPVEQSNMANTNARDIARNRSVVSPNSRITNTHLRWKKHEVILVCLVKGKIGGFEPVNGYTIGNDWDQKDVTPVCEVTTGIGGFVPVNGNTIGNYWSKEQVKPFVLVIPDGDDFVPAWLSDARENSVPLRWKKNDVVAVCAVKGVVGGFEPINGSAIGNRWDKEQITPICEVTTGIGGFVPLNGNIIGNYWSKDQVKPFVVVMPHDDDFVLGGHLVGGRL